jgi:hypothetical protein
VIENNGAATWHQFETTNRHKEIIIGTKDLTDKQIPSSIEISRDKRCHHRYLENSRGGEVYGACMERDETKLRYTELLG